MAGLYILGPCSEALAALGCVGVKIRPRGGDQHIGKALRLPLDNSQALNGVLKAGHSECRRN